MKIKYLFALILTLHSLLAMAAPEPTPTREIYSTQKPSRTTTKRAVPILAVKSNQRPHVFHADKGVREIPIDELDSYQKESVEKAKKILPPDETTITNTRVYQTPLGLWITIVAPEKSGAYFESYELLRKKDAEPILFYKHERAIDILTSHHGRLIVVNDSPASKSSEILVVDLKIKNNWQIDHQLIARYHKEVDAEGYLVLPVPVEFSPDDQKVLIRMRLGYNFSHRPEETELFQKKYDNWSYVVDSKSGKILNEYKASSVPEKWWLNN